MDRLILLILVTIVLFTVGGIIDYWQAAMEHKKKLHKHLEDFFLIIWLFVYSGLLPFLLVFIASNYDIQTTGIYFGAVCIGSVSWDVIYSFLDTGKPISDQRGYFVMKQKNYGLSSRQIALWHIIRLIIGSGLIFIFFT